MSLPQPYYQRGPVTIYNGDCVALLPHLPRVDAVVTDPPYGIGFSHGGGGGRLARSTRFDGIKIAGDDTPFDPTPFLAFRSVVLWGANHFASRLPDSSTWLVWDKRGGMCQNDQADCEMAWSNLGGPARLKTVIWNGMIRGCEERGVPMVHAMQKPVAIMQWCIEKASDEGDTILDPFLGSGTTAVAAIRTGRQCIGIELEERYCEIAARRCDRELDQGRLPFDEPAKRVETQRELFAEAAT